MARIRPPHDRAPMGVDGDRERGGGSQDHILHHANPHVHIELRAGRLGNT